MIQERNGGYIESLTEVLCFAANISVGNVKNLPLRRQLTLEALQASGIAASWTSLNKRSI
jgi:beta-lactamase class D